MSANAKVKFMVKAKRKHMELLKRANVRTRLLFKK